MYIRLLLEGLSSVAIGFLVWGYIWYKLRKHALQKIDYVYAFLGFAGVGSGLNLLDETYPDLFDLDVPTALKYRDLVGNIFTAANIFFLIIFIVLLIWMVRTRRSMRREWLLSDVTRQKRISVEEVLYDDRAGLLQLPVTIKTRVKWDLLIIPYIAVGMIFQIGLVFLFAKPGYRSWLYFALYEGILISAFGFIVLLLNILKERIDVSDNSLRVRRYGHVTKIHWSDMSFFALLQEHEIEVSSHTKTIRFTRHQIGSGFQPTVPYEEYTRQMDGLLLTIAERTQLPLYDLRDRKPF